MEIEQHLADRHHDTQAAAVSTHLVLLTARPGHCRRIGGPVVEVAPHLADRTATPRPRPSPPDLATEPAAVPFKLALVPGFERVTALPAPTAGSLPADRRPRGGTAPRPVRPARGPAGADCRRNLPGPRPRVRLGGRLPLATEPAAVPFKLALVPGFERVTALPAPTAGSLPADRRPRGGTAPRPVRPARGPAGADCRRNLPGPRPRVRLGGRLPLATEPAAVPFKLALVPGFERVTALPAPTAGSLPADRRPRGGTAPRPVRPARGPAGADCRRNLPGPRPRVRLGGRLPLATEPAAVPFKLALVPGFERVTALPAPTAGSLPADRRPRGGTAPRPVRPARGPAGADCRRNLPGPRPRVRLGGRLPLATEPAAVPFKLALVPGFERVTALPVPTAGSLPADRRPHGGGRAAPGGPHRDTQAAAVPS
ncbi:hypothetical protein [Candidatus Thiodictyon syntrophicum]|uniref:hypothetical protein n=1 Tax=Candidatus Thiodictyon syntrophicum TaxID=1166950 RepID=UPI0012FDD93A|nr:hypothetical protein [Candidatus Thiodictyon syntrophicum]